MKQCPACLPPDNKECGTCNGTSEVTEEAYSQFMIKKLELDAVSELSQKIQEILYSNNTLEEISNSIKLILEEI
jgi:hypothetical protein